MTATLGIYNRDRFGLILHLFSLKKGVRGPKNIYPPSLLLRSGPRGNPPKTPFFGVFAPRAEILCPPLPREKLTFSRTARKFSGPNLHLFLRVFRDGAKNPQKCPFWPTPQNPYLGASQRVPPRPTASHRVPPRPE